jgi:hypothetical protein
MVHKEEYSTLYEWEVDPVDKHPLGGSKRLGEDQIKYEG